MTDNWFGLSCIRYTIEHVLCRSLVNSLERSYCMGVGPAGSRPRPVIHEPLGSMHRTYAARLQVCQVNRGRGSDTCGMRWYQRPQKTLLDMYSL